MKPLTHFNSPRKSGNVTARAEKIVLDDDDSLVEIMPKQSKEQETHRIPPVFSAKPNKLSSREPKKEKKKPRQTHQIAGILESLTVLYNLPHQDPPSRQIEIPGECSKPTLIMDLDETLVHCCGLEPSQVSLTIPEMSLTIGMNIRPFAVEFLSRASAFFEIIIFTASQKKYADTVIDYLDPTNSFVKFRMYREDCRCVEGVFIKDLRVIQNRKLERIVIVDNAVHSFGFQLDNGIPISSWYSDEEDSQLMTLLEYLEDLHLCQDLIAVNRAKFGLKDFYDKEMQNLMLHSTLLKTRKLIK